MASTRDTVTYDEVVQIIARLEAAQEKVTVRRVEQEVGGGSHTTLTKHIQRYRDEQRAAQAAVPQDGMPDHVRVALSRWIHEAQVVAKEDADKRKQEADELYKAAQDGWESTVEQLKELEAELKETSSKAAEQEQTLRSEIAAQQARIEAADKQVAELKEKVATEQHNSELSRVTAAEARIKADAAADSIRTLGAANEELRAEVRAQNKALSAAEQRAAVAEERAKNRDEQLVETRTAGAKAADAAEELQKKLSETEKKLSVAERELAICREQHRGGRSGGGQGGDNGPGADGDTPRSGSQGRPAKDKDGGKREAAPIDGGQGQEAASNHPHADEARPQQVNVTMRKLGKPATPQEMSRSMEALLTCAPKLGHELFRGEAPKTHPRQPAGGAAGAQEQARP